MALSKKSPVYQHIAQNASLITLALLSMPIYSVVAILSTILSLGSKEKKQHRKNSKCLSFRSRVVLVTGVGMAKGLAIARAFHLEGHTVIGADFEPYGIPVCGRFSNCLKKFYRLHSSGSGSRIYSERVVKIIERESIELWISCSGVASAIEDGIAADLVGKRTSCKVIQFGETLTEMLHEKHSFIEKARGMGLLCPETELVTSVQQAMNFVYTRSPRDSRQYIMKSVGMDDSIRADMTLFPQKSKQETKAHISRLRPSPDRPFVLQQFINGSEYCTHSIVIRGKVTAFTACKSAGILMHYEALPSDSHLFKAMLKYTQTFARKIGNEMTGHFSIDFLVDTRNLEVMEEDMSLLVYPIECNPRAHTAVVLFEKDTRRMVEAYLSIFDNDDQMKGICIPHHANRVYWLGHDLIEHIMMPLLALPRRIDVSEVIDGGKIFLEHLRNWKEGTFVVWDPWPAWWLYCWYWSGMFLMSILTMSWWSKCNVSTNKIFRC